MPNRRNHEEFDYILEDKGIITSAEKGYIVHPRMDRGVRWYGRTHRENDYWHSEEGIRERLETLDNMYEYDQETLTNCIRMGLGHTALDKAKGDFNKALRIMKRRGWHRKFYRHRSK